ncbi:hypothetical protein OSB04_030228 [Centaurea solstitialis]|uniref:dihydropyrimidinase n=1 Tax=Centaurea solstitialis TaxID=347529 RepID=A0AA38S760_9ASTR|nr:hypothetical protein OSB04_030228 [Centaurea solstitialis]
MAHLRSLILLLSISLSPLSGLCQFCDSGLGYCDSDSALSSKILIKGGTVVNADHQEAADVYVEDGLIVAVRPNIKVADGVRVLDAKGKFVMPGGIDPHTHLAMEFMGTETIDNFFSGQAAALAGGTTMHIDFVIPVNGSLSKGYESYVEKAKVACMDYGFHMAITKWDDIVPKEMEIMVKEKGINSFKFFMAYKGSLMISDELLLEGLKKCKSLGALAMVHAENGDAVFEGQKRMIELGITGPEGHALSRPPVLEGEATARAIRLAAFVNTPLYVVHVMSSDAMEEIARAQKSGQKVIGEPVVSGLVLDDSVLWDPDFITAAKQVCHESPNKIIRAWENTSSSIINWNSKDRKVDAVFGTYVDLYGYTAVSLLQLVGTDHCTFNSTQKSFGIDDFRKIPNGVNGIGQISASDYVRVTSTECAKLFNIYPRKGAIRAGSDADIIIFNPNSTFWISAHSHHSRSDTNVYEGRSGKGKVEVTIAGGRIVWENDELNVVPGSGRYISMPPFNYLYHGIDKADANYLTSLKAPVKREDKLPEK